MRMNKPITGNGSAINISGLPDNRPAKGEG